MKTIPTFITREKKCLVGREAKEAWAAQEVGCGCGDYGETDCSVGGTANDMPAEWLGCPNCGTALGMPLVYRLPSQMPQTVEQRRANWPAGWPMPAELLD